MQCGVRSTLWSYCYTMWSKTMLWSYGYAVWSEDFTVELWLYRVEWDLYCGIMAVWCGVRTKLCSYMTRKFEVRILILWSYGYTVWSEDLTVDLWLYSAVWREKLTVDLLLYNVKRELYCEVMALQCGVRTWSDNLTVDGQASLSVQFLLLES